MKKFIVMILIALMFFLLSVGIESLMAWGVGSFIVWAFGINFNWTFWHGVAAAISLEITRSLFAKK